MFPECWLTWMKEQRGYVLNVVLPGQLSWAGGGNLRNPVPAIVPSSSSTVILSGVFLQRAVPRWKEAGGGCSLYFCSLHELISMGTDLLSDTLTRNMGSDCAAIQLTPIFFCAQVLPHNPKPSSRQRLDRIQRRTHGDLSCQPHLCRR